MSLVMDVLVCLDSFVFMPYTLDLCNFSALEIHIKGKRSNCFSWKYCGWLPGVINAVCVFGNSFHSSFNQCKVYRIYTEQRNHPVKGRTASIMNSCRGLYAWISYEASLHNYLVGIQSWVCTESRGHRREDSCKCAQNLKVTLEEKITKQLWCPWNSL